MQILRIVPTIWGGDSYVWIELADLENQSAIHLKQPVARSRVDSYLADWTSDPYQTMVEKNPTDEFPFSESRCGYGRSYSKPTIVYFVQGWKTKLIKIGAAACVETRLEKLQRFSPDRLILLGTIDGDVALEKSIHAQFHLCRSHGEWFRPTQLLLDYIAMECEVACHD